MRRLAGLLAAGVLAAGCQDYVNPTEPGADAGAALNSSPTLSAAGAQDDVYIVVLKSQVQDVDVEAARLSRDHGGDLAIVYRHALKGFAARLSDQEALALARESDVLLVEKDQPVHATITQTNATWGLDRIDQRNLPLSTTYTYNQTGAGVNVYVIDTGIRTTHNQFGGRATGAFTSINDGNGTNDCDGHGTHVSGTIGGSIHGVAKDVNLYAVRVLNCSGSGTWSGVIAGVDWVTANAVKPAVANMSLGGGASSVVDAAVANSIASGVVYAISAGNDNWNACNNSPARVGTAITVGATTTSDARASFSNWGSCVDIFAPGQSITSAYNSSNTATAILSGTSMSSPHVAGVAALYLETNPNATPAQVANALTSNATTNVISNPGTGSPNRLLYMGFLGGAPPPGPSVFLNIHGGNNQTGEVNTRLAQMLLVKVVDGQGNPLANVPVSFNVVTGGGEVRAVPDVTGPLGIAGTGWTLGPLVGEQTVEASAPGAATITFKATATDTPPPPPPPPPQPTLFLQIQSGNNQTGPAGSPLPQLLIVKVVDGNGNPVAGVPVSFQVLTGGGSIPTSPDVTGPKGIAGKRWTLGPTLGTQTAQASAPGANPVVFTATAN
jgi:subtilisin family serine protease